MVILAVDRQAEVFLYSLMIGAAAGFFYDALKILRLMIPHSKFMESLEDGIYWVACAFTMFALMLKNNSGEIRLFSITAFFGAMIIYNLTLSRVLMAVSQKVVYLIKKALRLFFEIILTPFRLVWLLIRRPVVFARNKAQKRGRRVLILIKKYAKINIITAKERLRSILK